MMRTLVLAGVGCLLAAVPPGPLPQALVIIPVYGFVTNRGDGTVSVFDSGSRNVVATISVGSVPWDIVAAPSRRKLYVSHNIGSGVISVIDGDSFEVAAITVTGAASFQGMFLAPDESAIFIAGRNATLGEAGVYRLDLASNNVTYVAGIATSTAGAVDCAAVYGAAAVAEARSRAAPTPVGPLEKVYFTVPQDNFIGIIDVGGNSTSSISVTGSTTAPTRMALTPDGSTLYVTASHDAISTTDDIAFVEIDTATDASVVRLIAVEAEPTVTRDIVFVPGTGPPFKAFAVGDENGAGVLWELSFTPGVGAGWVDDVYLGGYDPMTVALRGARLYVGDLSGSSSTYRTLTSGPLGTPESAFSGQGPTSFAFLEAPLGPWIQTAEPNFAAPGDVVVVRGENFFGTSEWFLGDGFTTPEPIPSTSVQYVSSTEVRLSMPTVPTGTYGIGVVNPDGQQWLLGQWLTFPDRGAAFEFDVTGGTQPADYEMVSFPIFATLGDLRSALVSRLGTYNPSTWRAFIMDEQGRYVELPQWPARGSMTGRSFWLLTRNGGRLRLEGGNTDDAGPSSKEIGATLWPGWNMVSTPHDFGSPLAEVQAGVLYGTREPVGPSHSLGIDRFHTWVPSAGDYMVETSSLLPGVGYFVFNAQEYPLQLWMGPDTGIFRIARAGSAVSSTLVPLEPGEPRPPPPPGATAGGASSRQGCGLLGPELLLPALIFAARFPRRRRGRKVSA